MGHSCSGAHGSYSHPHVGCAAGPALCGSAQLPKAASGFLGSLLPGICSSGHIVSLGQRLEPLLGAGQHWVGWSKTFLGLFVTGGGLREAAVGLAGPLSSGFQLEGTTLCRKLRRPSKGQDGQGLCRQKPWSLLWFFRVLLRLQLTKMSHNCQLLLSCGSQM